MLLSTVALLNLPSGFTILQHATTIYIPQKPSVVKKRNVANSKSFNKVFIADETPRIDSSKRLMIEWNCESFIQSSQIGVDFIRNQAF